MKWKNLSQESKQWWIDLADEHAKVLQEHGISAISPSGAEIQSYEWSFLEKKDIEGIAELLYDTFNEICNDCENFREQDLI
jgi:hypothetical protein